MDRRAFIRNFPMGIMIGAATAHALKSIAWPSAYETLKKEPKNKKDPNEILKDIYKEVLEFGIKNKEGFIKKEFHVDLDGNETNSEEHIVVLIYNVRDREKMIVQVTYFETRGNITMKYAKDTKVISCFIKGEKIEIEKCDYNKKEIKSLLTDILKEIRYKKKLLKLIDRKK